MTADLFPATFVRALRDGGLLRTDLTSRQVAVLALASVPAPELREFRAMASALGVTGPVISRAADRLAKLGLAERTAVADDLRLVRLRTTPAGEAMLDRLRAAFAPTAPTPSSAGSP